MTVFLFVCLFGFGVCLFLKSVSNIVPRSTYTVNMQQINSFKQLLIIANNYFP